LGFSRLEQIDENLKCLELYAKWNKEIEDKCEKLLANTPDTDVNFRQQKKFKSRRQVSVLDRL
jgi:hypothetical protein